MSVPVNFYADFKGLASLKNDATKQDPKALRETAKQFESLFTQMMMKSMREASSSFRSKDSLTESDQTDFYREMFDNQMAVQMSKGKGLGLADVLVRQLQGVAGVKATPHTASDGKTPGIDIKDAAHAGQIKIGANGEERASLKIETRDAVSGANQTGLKTLKSNVVGVNHTIDSNSLHSKVEEGRMRVLQSSVDAMMNAQPVTDPSDLSRLMLNIAQVRSAETSPSSIASGAAEQAESEPKAEAIPADRADVSRSELNTNSSSDAERIATSPREFANQLWPHAKAVAEELGVDPHMLIAQAALETGWGKSIPCNPDGTCSFNLFGIKAGSRWQGPAVGVNTIEFESGVAVQRRASFRAYESLSDSFRDYATLIKNSPRYAAAVGTGNDGVAFANALQQGGYATDPNYATKLTAVAERLKSTLKTDTATPLASNGSVSIGRGGET